MFLSPISGWGQDELNVIRGNSSNNRWAHFSDAANSLYHHLSHQAYDLMEERAAFVSNLETLSDWKQRQEAVRETLLGLVGPFPPKSPLNAQIIRTVEKPDYRVEHIVFESQPGFHVSSSLFIPDGIEEQAPTILYFSGHTETGYRAATYQHIILNLVKKGFIVFAIDPVGQGERKEYYDPDSNRSVVGGGTSEHAYSGAQAFLTQSSQARYMTWDGIRAVDFLLTRSEVDPERIGATGRSGGGTQTAFISALDDRIYAAAPEAYISTFTRLLQTIGPQDAEQNIYHGLLYGLDHADFLVARAPMPALLIATTEDFFSIQGSREAAKEVSALYNAYGKEDYFAMTEDAGSHQSTPKNREAMYAFFQEHLENPGSPDDVDVEILTDAEIQATPTGQVSTSFQGETVFSLNRMEAEELMRNLQALRDDPETHLPDILKSAKNLSGYQAPEAVSEPVFTGRIQRDGYMIEKYFIPGEGDYVIPYLLMVPETPNNRGLIYLHPAGKAAEAAEGGEMEWFVRNGFTVLAPDMLGTGELGPGEVANYAMRVKEFEPASFDVWTASVLIGRSITGIRAGDVVRLVQLLERDSRTKETYGVARQDMSPVLLHAAAFEQSLSRVALLAPYISYSSIAMNRFYDPGFHISSVAGSVGAYDLPDLAASLAPRRLMMAGVTDATGQTENTEALGNDYRVIRGTYERMDAQTQLIIRELSDDLDDLFSDWIE
ncbi:MAG: acetylxylan esterase [Opitutales bacterium]